MSGNIKPQNVSTGSLIRFAQHDQELHDVMFEVEHCDTRHGRLIFTMAEKGLVHALNESDLRELRSEEQRIYPPNERDSPILSSDEIQPFGFHITTEETQHVLKQDIGGENFFRFVPSRGTPERDANAALKLLNNIGIPRYCEEGSIIHMKSPTFDHLLSESMNWKGAGCLGQSPIQMTVAPAGQMFELGHYEHHFFSTLLSGTKIWLAFPPLPGNLDILQKAYNEVFAKRSFQIPTDVLLELQHGIVIIQKPGQSLVIPPFWAVLSLCTECSASAAFFIASATNFTDRIRNMDVWIAQNRIWDNQEQEQEHIVSYATELANHFSSILKNKVESFQADKLIAELCRTWATNSKDVDENSENDPYPQVDIQGWALKKSEDDFRFTEDSLTATSFRDQIVRICEMIENQEKRSIVEQIFQTAWTDLLMEKCKKKPECRLCHVRVEHMQAGDSRKQRLEQHFKDFHWTHSS